MMAVLIIACCCFTKENGRKGGEEGKHDGLISINQWALCKNLGGGRKVGAKSADFVSGQTKITSDFVRCISNQVIACSCCFCTLSWRGAYSQFSCDDTPFK